MKGLSLLLSLWIVLAAHSGDAHDPQRQADASEAIGLEERTGGYLPQDLTFHDENGREIKLADLLGKPAILTLVYYRCDRVCPFLLSGLAEAVPRLAMALGKDYRVITVSFDETDTPQSAGSMKRNYLKTVQTDITADNWALLLANGENIAKLTNAVGFRFRKVGSGFDHPVVLIFLTPQGKISGYLQATNYAYGAQSPIGFSSFELNMALTEASQGKAVTGLSKAILYCFSHEPPGQSRFFNFIAIVGIITLLAMISFFVYLQWSSKRYRKSHSYDGEK